MKRTELNLRGSQYELAGGVLKQTPTVSFLFMRNVGQRCFHAKPSSLGGRRARLYVVSRSIRVKEDAAPIRQVLIFDDHPATIRLLHDAAVALEWKNKLALVGCSALIILLVLAMFWPLL